MDFPVLFIPIMLIFFSYNFFRRLIYKLPPGPFPLPVIGNLYNMDSDTTRCFERWTKKYGRIISVWIGTNLNIVVSSSELAKEVLKDKDRQLAHRIRNIPVGIMSKHGKGLVWSDYGPQYVKLRKIITLELFSPRRVEELRIVREKEVKIMIQSILKETIEKSCDVNSDKSLVLRKYLHLVIFNSVTMLVFGKRFMNEQGVIDDQGSELESLVNSELKLATSLFPAEHIWWLGWLFLLQNKAFTKHLSRRERFIRSIMQDHRVKSKEGQAKPHLVDGLLSLDETHELGEDNITGLLWDMVNTGMDTSTVAVEYAMAELVKNPRVQSKVQEELDQVIGPGRILSETDVPNLPYLQCVVKESLRLHPPAPLMLPHKAISDVKIGGYDVPKGTNVFVNVQAVGRDPTVWKDPLDFRPERFLEEDVEIRGSDFRVLPFGAGRRACPAAVLSFNMVTSMIGCLLHHFSWAPPDGMLPEDINLTASPGVSQYLRTPLQVLPTMRLPQHLYTNEQVEVN